METGTFYEYIVIGLYPELVNKGVKFPVIIFLDGHKSHISLELHDFCNNVGIHMYCFVPHASHIMQPCDVGIFGPLKKEWRLAMSNYAQTTTKIITKKNFAPIFDIAYKKSQNCTTIQNAFKRSGLYPFDAD